MNALQFHDRYLTLVTQNGMLIALIVVMLVYALCIRLVLKRGPSYGEAIWIVVCWLLMSLIDMAHLIHTYGK